MRLGLLSASALAGASLFFTMPAVAQEAQAESLPPPGTPRDAQAPGGLANADGTAARQNDIIITGSRIPRPETSGVLPGVSVDAAQIQARGFTNALEALNDIPLVGPGASPLNGNNGNQPSSLGSAFVDLLDLGTARTLTLVNGRRFVSGNAASLFVSGNETGSQVDVNVIPTSLIQRIDVLTVGGAAAYGADAVAGVVNYILKEDYSGAEIRGLSGITSRGDAAQYQLNALVGRNFFDGRLNITLAGEYSRNDGLQAVSRDFRNARPASYTNPFNGGVRNPNFAPTAFIDVANLNNGAFLRNADDGQAATLFGLGFITQTLSNPGTVLNAASTTYYTPYTPITATVGGQLRTSNYITFQNGVAPVGFAINATTPTGTRTTIPSLNDGFYSTTAGQIIKGTPGADAISTNGLNGRTTQATNVPFTTFAPTSLPGNVTAAQVFAAYGIAPPAQTGAQSTAQYNAALTLLAVNTLQANRFTAREFLAANPGVNPNYFIGTFDPLVPRVANTDTTLVSVKVNSGTVQVPVNQVLPFRAVPLEFTPAGVLREYRFTGPITVNTPLTISSSIGSDGGFNRSLENTVLRTQQDRYIANLIAKFEISDALTFFTENSYANVLNRSLGNIAGAQNFMTNTQENAALLVNYTNPYLTAQNRAVLSSVGIAPGQPNQGNFLITRQNQDLFGANPYTNRQETFRLVGGLRSHFHLLGKPWNAELSGTFGKATQNTRTMGIGDVEYQLALDAVDAGVAAGGAANGTIVCRAKLFAAQYLGRTPIGTAENITRIRGADGLPTEILTTPTITQGLIDACQPLNPFGYDNMSQAAKNYVTKTVAFHNVSKQTYVQGTVGGEVFDMPSGDALAINVAGEYRREELQFTSNDTDILGRARTAPSSNTAAYTETFEFGGEARIPITGADFIPFLGEIEFDPAVRVTKQNGQAATYRNLAGVVGTPKASGDLQTIFSLAGTWRPLRDIFFRGNYTRSVRQPSIVELFLGGQPVFTTPTDLCGPANINGGNLSANRVANCRAAVIAAGLATDSQSAATFLASFVPSGTGLQGTYSGTPDLRPEKGESWTAGGVFTPRFVPGLSLSADYIDLLLKDTIVPTTIQTVLQTCYDSPTYPDSTAQLGVNTCGLFARDANFQLANGFTIGFLNLGAIKIHAINISGSYPIRVAGGRFTINANAYHLITYQSSSAGDFSDTQESAGTLARPKWETRLSGRFEKGGVFGQVTWNWKSATRIFVSGLPATTEQYPYSRYPDLSQVDFVIGAQVNDRFRLQFNLTNLTDTTTAGDLGYRFADYFDQIGRRFQMSATISF